MILNILFVILSRRRRKKWANVNVIMGLMAATGETTTTGALLRAKNSEVMPAEETIPERPNHIKPRRDDVRRSWGMWR